MDKIWQWLSPGPQREEAQVTSALFILALNWIITSAAVCWWCTGIQIPFVSLYDSTFHSVCVLPSAVPVGRLFQNISSADF